MTYIFALILSYAPFDAASACVMVTLPDSNATKYLALTPDGADQFDMQTQIDDFCDQHPETENQPGGAPLRLLQKTTTSSPTDVYFDCDTREVWEVEPG